MAAWAGLGYARARNLHRAAQMVCTELGRFPQDDDGLRALPVGPYERDRRHRLRQAERGRRRQIERVMARYFAVDTPAGGEAELGGHYAAVRPDDRPSDFPQALTDFANAVYAKNPGCPAARLRMRGEAAGTQDMFPVKPPKKAKPARRGIAFVAFDKQGRAFMQTRPGGMLGGMLAFPSAGWTDADPPTLRPPFASAPSRLNGGLPKTPSVMSSRISRDHGCRVAKLETSGHGAGWQKVSVLRLPTLCARYGRRRANDPRKASQ